MELTREELFDLYDRMTRYWGESMDIFERGDVEGHALLDEKHAETLKLWKAYRVQSGLA